MNIIIINVICNNFKKYSKIIWINLLYGHNIFSKYFTYKFNILKIYTCMHNIETINANNNP